MDYFVSVLAEPELLEYVVSLFLGFISVLLARYTSLKLSQKAQDDLHRALMTGIGAALADGRVGQAAITAAVSYAQKSVPDAIKRLSPPEAVLANLAKSKVTQAIGLDPSVVDVAKRVLRQGLPAEAITQPGGALRR